MRPFLAAVLASLAALPAAADAATLPIPGDRAAGTVPAFEGAPATPRRIASPEPPRHPFMAPNGRSNLHDDAYQTDAYRHAGPLGRGTSVKSTLQVADCGSVTFDSKGRIVTICVGITHPTLHVMDPVTLDSLASEILPLRNFSTLNVFTDFTGGGYFYLDHRDRAVFPTNTRRLRAVAVRDRPGGGVGFTNEADIDLGSAVPSDDKIISALPDWSGLVWFASTKGVVGTADLGSGRVRSIALGEAIQNSFAVDEDGGVYIVTDKALYRLEAAAGGVPKVVWRHVYRNSGISKPGQVGPGSGTTPTVMERGRIAITDNADPMNVVVLERGRSVSGSRVICEHPVFRKGASATDNSLIAARNSIVVENNYGYTGITATMDGRSTTPGIERIDVRKDGKGCRTVWRSNVTSPTVVPKLSLENGLVYVYEKPPRSDGIDAWYLSALDFCTGARRFRRLGGSGFGFNNNYAPVTLGPDGTAYVGVLGGLLRFADSRPPAGPPASAPSGCNPRPRLRLAVRRARDRSCRVVAAVRGRDRGRVRRVAFRVSGARRRVTDGRSPFRSVMKGPRRAAAVRAFARLRDGSAVRLRARVGRCRPV